MSMQLSSSAERYFAPKDSGLVESRVGNGVESFFKNLKVASFFVQILITCRVSVKESLSVGVKKRGSELVSLTISSISTPTGSFAESEIATAQKAPE